MADAARAASRLSVRRERVVPRPEVPRRGAVVGDEDGEHLNVYSGFLTFGYFWANVERLILGCIEADFCDQILILQNFSKLSTRFANLCAATNSKLQSNRQTFRENEK